MSTKTLVISEVFPPLRGGSGRWFFELYSRLPINDFVIAAGSTDGDKAFDSTHPLRIKRINLSSNQWGIVSLQGLRYYWRTFIHLRRIIIEHNINNIHCGRCLPEGVFGWIFKKLYGLPYLCYIHGEDIEAAASSREQSLIVRHVLNNAKFLITNSNNSKQLLLDKWDVPETNIKVLHPGMDANRFVPADEDHAIKKNLNWAGKTVLLTVGRLQKRKGQDILIQALPLIMKEHKDIFYSIVGDGEEMQHLQQLVEQLGLRDNVQFLSKTSDEQLIQCYQQCTIFILPNRTIDGDIEGFGMVLAEAQSCGKPVIAGDSGGTRETMLVGVTGEIVDCSSPDPLAKTVLSMLLKRDKFDEIGQKARAHVVSFLDWSVHTNKALQIFKLLN